MIDKEILKTMYRRMYTIRRFEQEGIKLYRKGIIKGYFHPYIGQEGIAVGVCAALRDEDFTTSTHRGHGHSIARGADIKKMYAELLGKETGYCRGYGGSMHIADTNLGFLGANGIVGAGCAHGVGATLGAKIRGEKRVAGVFSSDGATLGGVFAESVNLAAIWKLPVLFIVENNHYAVATPIEKMSATESLVEKGKGLGIKAVKIDGNDVIKVYEEAKSAVEYGLEGNGPVMIECDTYRHQGHHVSDMGAYMPKDKLDHYKSIDPLTRGRKALVEMTSEKEAKAIEAAVEKEIEDGIQFAQESPEPDPQQFLAEVQTRFN